MDFYLMDLRPRVRAFTPFDFWQVPRKWAWAVLRVPIAYA
jgi:hypothetical protein